MSDTEPENGDSDIQEDDGYETWAGNFVLKTEEDNELIEFLEQSEDMNQQIVNLLNLGKAVYLAATFSTTGDALRELLRPLDERINSLTTTIEAFQGKTKNASVIGTMGEDIAKNQFSERFNEIGDGFEIDSTRGHQGDILGSMKIVTDTGVEMVPVLIEAKEYSGSPGSDQISKFWDDMEENKPNYGMMISFKKPIATKKSAIDIENRGGKVAFFISNDSHDDLRHIVAWEMLRMIIKTDLETGLVGQGVSRQVETMMQNLNLEISQLENAQEHLGQIKRTAENILQKAGEHSQELYFSVAEIRSTINHSIRRMKHLISNAGEEYAVAAEQLLEWKENVMDVTFGNFTKEQVMLISVIEPPIQNNREDVEFEVSTDGKEVTLNSSVFQDRSVTFTSQKTNLVILFDLPLRIGLVEGMGATDDKGKYKISIPPTKKHYGKQPFNEIRQALELLFADPIPVAEDNDSADEEGTPETEAVAEMQTEESSD